MDKAQGDRLRKARKSLGLTQKELGKKVDVPWYIIKNIETGKTKLSPFLINLLYYEFKISSDWLRDGQGDMFIKDSPLSTSDEKDISEHAKEIVKDALEDILKKAYNVKKARPIDPGIKRPLIRLAQCGTPVKIAYDTGELTTIGSEYEHIDMVVLTEGDSMKEEFIPPGAKVYIKKQSICEAGQIVLICNHDIAEEPMLVLKKTRCNGKGIVFVNGKGDVIPLGEKIEIVGVAKHVMIDF